MRTFLNHIKNETLDEIKTSLENLCQQMIQLSEFFQYSSVLILKRKCLVRASRVRSRETGTSSTIIYTRWSSRRYELGCDTPVLWIWWKESRQQIRSHCQALSTTTSLKLKKSSNDMDSNIVFFFFFSNPGPGRFNDCHSVTSLFMTKNHGRLSYLFYILSPHSLCWPFWHNRTGSVLRIMPPGWRHPCVLFPAEHAQ